MSVIKAHLPAPVNRLCQNLIGGFECICPAGFEWAEGDCQDVDECATANGFCGPSEHVQCINQVGEPPRCVDIDECLKTTANNAVSANSLHA